MTAQALLFTLSCIGISETVYLIKKRLSLQKPFCPIGENCLAVLESKYSRIFIVPNDILGLLFYIFTSVITVLLVIGVGPLLMLSIAMKIMVISGSLLSVFFTYLQFKVIKAWCVWCLISACTIWLMGVTILLSDSIK